MDICQICLSYVRPHFPRFVIKIEHDNCSSPERGPGVTLRQFGVPATVFILEKEPHQADVHYGIFIFIPLKFVCFPFSISAVSAKLLDTEMCRS